MLIEISNLAILIYYSIILNYLSNICQVVQQPLASPEHLCYRQRVKELNPCSIVYESRSILENDRLTLYFSGILSDQSKLNRSDSFS